MMVVDIAEFTSDYMRMDGMKGELRERGRGAVARDIAEAWCERNPDLEELSESEFMDVAHNSIAPQIEYYLP